MGLRDDIADNAELMRARAHELDGWLNELKALLPESERARQVFTNARRTIGCIHSEITQMQTTLAAARMCGAMTDAPPVPVPVQTEMPMVVELRAASRPPRPRRLDGKMLAAGDHTDEVDDESDRLKPGLQNGREIAAWRSVERRWADGQGTRPAG